MNIEERISNYLAVGGLFNPELMEHDKVRDLIIECRDTIASLRQRYADTEADGIEFCGKCGKKL